MRLSNRARGRPRESSAPCRLRIAAIAQSADGRDDELVGSVVGNLGGRKWSAPYGKKTGPALVVAIFLIVCEPDEGCGCGRGCEGGGRAGCEYTIGAKWFAANIVTDGSVAAGSGEGG